MKNLNKKFLLIFVTILLSLTTLIGVALLTRSNEQNEDKVISVSIFPIYNIASQLSEGSDVEINLLLEPGLSPHSFSPSTSELAKLSNSQKLFIIGYNLDNWAEENTKDISNEIKIVHLDKYVSLIEYEEENHTDEEVDAHEDESEMNSDSDKDGSHSEDEESDHNDTEKGEHDDDHDHEGIDPHYWLSIENSKLIAKQIKEELIELDSENKSIFENNYNEFIESLEKLEEELNAEYKLDGKGIITFHNSFNYLAQEFDFEILTTVEEFPGINPTPAYFNEVNEKIRENNVSEIYIEPQLSPAVSDSLVKDYDLQVKTLDPLGGVNGINSIQELIKYNIMRISEGE